jgi:hypothetical protein
MRKTIVGSEALLCVLFVAVAVAAIIPVALAVVYSSEFEFLQVPFASWFVFGLSGLILALDGIAFHFWRRLHRTGQELIALMKQPLEDEIPAIYGHKYLDSAEFLVILQILFRRPPEVKYVHVKPLPGGYGGSTTVLAELQPEQGDPPWSRSFVVKLGDRHEMADEHDKFQKYVLQDLPHAARFFRHAAWEDLAGIAYEFVGLDLDNEIRSFYQFYKGYAAVEVAELIEDIYSHLSRAWYRKGQIERVNLYDEYSLLSKKQEFIVGHVGEIVDEDDPYRVNFTVIEERLRPNLKPRFCPEADVPWHDPVAFLRTWPGRNLKGPVYRSVVHGDLHAQNVLVEIGREGQKRVWFIDFSHTGNGLSGHRTREAIREGMPIHPDRGHTLRDFCRLEADVKFILTRLQDDDDLRLAVAFERELMACGLALYDLSATPPRVEALMEGRFQKAWRVIREIRRRAATCLASADDLRPYYLGLLHATLFTVYYHRDQFEDEVCERQQKRYALISAGMLCSQL